MPVITKANAAHYQQLAKAAQRRKAQARKEAEALAASILQNDPSARAKVSLATQLAAIHEVIMLELKQVERGRVRSVKLGELVVVQGELIKQTGGLWGEEVKVSPELSRVIREDPEVAIKGVQDAAKEVIAGVELSEHDTVV